MQATCSCAARNIYNSLSNIEKKITSTFFSANDRQTNSNPPPVVAGSDLSFADCECRPVKECNCKSPEVIAPTKSESVDSQDLAMIDVIRGMAIEEQRLTSELNELSEKEKSYEKAMEFCNAMFSNKSAPSPAENPQLANLKEINKNLVYRNDYLKDSIDDVNLELKQLKEKINGPMKRELERAKRRCMECECECSRVIKTNGTDIKNNELDFLKEQLETTYNNIADLHTINAEIRQEVLVLNYKCNKLQELLIKNKLDEINTIKNLTADCTCN